MINKDKHLIKEKVGHLIKPVWKRFKTNINPNVRKHHIRNTTLRVNAQG